MSQREYRRVEKNDSHIQNNPRRHGRPGRPNSAAQPHYQWVSSAEGRGRGGDNRDLPPPSHPSTNRRFKKSTGQGEQSRGIIAGVNLVSRLVQNTHSTKSGLSEPFDASTAEVPSKSTVPYKQGDGQGIPKAASSKSPPRTTYSAASTTPLRGEPMDGVSLQSRRLNRGFANEMKAPQPSLKQERTESTSSASRKQQTKEDMEQSKSGISHLQLKAKRDVRWPHSSKQKQYNCSKLEATSSTSSMYSKQHVEDDDQSKNATTDIQPEAKTDMHVQVVSVSPVVNSSRKDVSLPIPGVSAATSSLQQPHFQPQIGISTPQTWSEGMASASIQMPIQLPIRDSNEVQQSAFISSFQPYALQPPDLMHYGQGLYFPSPVGYQTGSQFVNLNGIPRLHVQSDVRNGTPRRPVKITHPETKEELKLDEIAKQRLDGGFSGTRAYPVVQLQAQPLSYGYSHLTNYFSHMQSIPFSLHSPTSVTFSSTQMFPSSTELRLQYLDMPGAVVGSKSADASSASFPSSFKPNFGSAEENILSIASVKPVVKDKNEANKLARPQRVGSSRGKSKTHSEIIVKPPPKAVTKLAISDLSSVRTIPSAVSTYPVPVEGVLIGKAVSEGDKRSVAIGELPNLEKKDNVQSQQLPQAKTSSFPYKFKMASCEVSECPSLEEPKQSDSVSHLPLIMEHSISGIPKFEDINFEATPSAEGSGGASVSHTDAGNRIYIKGAGLGGYPSEIQSYGEMEMLSKLEETNMFVQPVADNICQEQNMNGMRLPEINEQIKKGKTELEDWKDVTEIFAPELHSTRKVELQNLRNAAADSSGVTGKKRYSRDFLLTFSSQFVELPADFDLVSDMVKGLILGSAALDDRRYKVEDETKWTKTPAPSESELDQLFDISWGNSGVHSSRGTYCRTLHGQTSDHCDAGFPTESLPNLTSHGGRSKGPDADRWQQGVVLHKGLLPLPRSPLQVMHRAEKKYEVHKVIDGEEAKQRQLKAILNKLTPQNFDKLFQQVKEVNIDNTFTLSGLISQIFDKALTEPTFCEMYANFCYHLAGELPNFVEGHEKITFKRLLLNKCQEEFVRGEREQAEANRMEKDGEARLSQEKREEKKIRARRRMLGNIRLIGELYKKKMLTEKVMHECIKKLLGDYDYPDEEDVEALCNLMSTVGEIIDHPKAKVKMNAYFEVIKNLSNNAELSSRMRFMLKDVIDLRKNKWQQRRKVEGPKKIEELHSDAAHERRAIVSQLTYGPKVISSNKRVSGNLSPRPSTLQSPQNSRVGAFLGVPPQVHGCASQDVRLEEKHLYKRGTQSKQHMPGYAHDTFKQAPGYGHSNHQRRMHNGSKDSTSTDLWRNNSSSLEDPTCKTNSSIKFVNNKGVV